MNTLLVTDIHGCWFTLVRLLNATPKPFRLILLGDLIDRGPHSRQVVEFAMQNAIPCVAGNHEDLCLSFYSGSHAHCDRMYDRGVWLDNGGDKAVRNWNSWDSRKLTERERMQAQGLGGRVPEDVLDWMAALPAYLYPTEELDANGRRLLASHTGYGLDADDGDWFRALWGRRAHGDGHWVGTAPDTGEEVDDGLHRVFGHTSVRVAQVTDQWSCIDTGAAYPERGGGILSALLWPSKQVLTQPYDETPVIPRFTVTAGGCIAP